MIELSGNTHVCRKNRDFKVRERQLQEGRAPGGQSGARLRM